MLSNLVERYDVVNGIALANPGINIGQLMRGDASAAAAKARKLFGGKIVKHLVPAIKESRTSRNFMRYPATDSKTEPKMLKLAEVQVYGTPIMTLFDSGAIPDVMSSLCQVLYPTPSSTNLRITIVDNKKAAVIGAVNRVSITLGRVTFELFCSVVQTTPYHLIFVHPSMMTMRASLNFDKDLVTFRHRDGVTKLPLVTEGIHKDVSLSDEFTSDGESNED